MIRQFLAAVAIGAVFTSCASFDEFVSVLSEIDSGSESQASTPAPDSEAQSQIDAQRSARFESNWEWVTPATGSYDLHSVVAANGEFLAVGDNGALLRSDDGVSWDLEQLSGGDLVGVAYAEGRYVIAGTDPEAPLHFSDNGAEWYVSEFEESVRDGSYRLPRGLTWTGSHFLALALETSDGISGQTVAYRSADGQHWERLSLPRVSGTFRFIDTVNGVTFFSFSNSVLRYSLDSGDSWEDAESADDRQISGISQIVFDEERDSFLAVRAHNWQPQSHIYESSDGMTWSHLLEYDGGRFVSIIPHGGSYLLSQAHESAPPFYRFDNGELTVYDSPPMRSDGVVPQLRHSIVSGGATLAVGMAGSIAAFGSDGEVLEVLGGNEFDGNTVRSVARDENGLFVAVGNDSAIYTSTDGRSWEAVELPLEGVAPEDTLWQVIGTGNGFAAWGSVAAFGEPIPLVITSEDGRSWGPSGANQAAYYVSVNRLAPGSGSSYVGIGGTAVSDGRNIIRRSTTLFNFSDAAGTVGSVPLIDDYTFRDAVYDDSRYLMVGDEGMVATSTDGLEWEVRSSGFEEFDLRRVVHFGGLYIAISSTFADEQVLLTSRDGVNWRDDDATPDYPWDGIIEFREIDGALYGISSDYLWRTTNGLLWRRERVPGGVQDLFRADDGSIMAVGENGMLLSRR